VLSCLGWKKIQFLFLMAMASISLAFTKFLQKRALPSSSWQPMHFMFCSLSTGLFKKVWHHSMSRSSWTINMNWLPRWQYTMTRLMKISCHIWDTYLTPSLIQKLSQVTWIYDSASPMRINCDLIDKKKFDWGKFKQYVEFKKSETQNSKRVESFSFHIY